jgi:hypothetical protein
MKSNKIMASFEFDSQKLSEMFKKSEDCLNEIKNMTHEMTQTASRSRSSSGLGIEEPDISDQISAARDEMFKNTKKMIETTEQGMYNKFKARHGNKIRIRDISEYIS